MSARDRLRFDVDALRELAGAKVFARGVAYHRDGQVEILSIRPGRVLAQVEGTEDYRTELRGDGKKIDGKCSCRAFEDFGFCKHMVATGLAANDIPAGEGDASGALDRIRDHLKEKSVDALVEMILDMVERDLALFRKLDAAAASIHEDDKTLAARLRRMIDSATRTGDLVDYDEASGWAAKVDSVLEGIAGLASGARAGLAVELAEYAIDRIEQAVEGIDDSEGYCSMLLEQARDIHLAAIHEVRPEPIRLARDLFAREMKDEYGTFGGAVVLYGDALGETGLAEYYRLASEAWEKISRSTRGRMQREEEEEEEFVDNQDRLMGILDFFAERAGDVDSRIALRARTLSSQWSYLQLAEFCLSHGREEEALRRAEEGLWMFEDQRPDERLVLFAAGLLSKAGRNGDAETHLQRAFEKSPTLELYKKLGKLGGEPAAARALAFLNSRLTNNGRGSGHNRADLLVEILMHEKRFDAAWSTVHKCGVSVYTKQALVEATDVKYPREALEFYAAQVEQLANSGGYAEAVKLIARMAQLRSAGEQVTFVANLKARHGRKRNFMKLLG